MAEDDRAVMERLAALDAEVKADADAQRARKDAALARLREQKATQQAERARDLASTSKRMAAARPAAAAASSARMRAARDLGDEDGDGDGDTVEDDGDAKLSNAIELASKANKVHKELARAPGQGEKSWVKSGLASLVLGPLGWLYAGSLREAVPASAAWILLATLASKILPAMLLWPIMFVAMPLSAIAGVVYALHYNRAGRRQRLWGPNAAATHKDKAAKLKDKKQLAP